MSFIAGYLLGLEDGGGSGNSDAFEIIKKLTPTASVSCGEWTIDFCIHMIKNNLLLSTVYQYESYETDSDGNEYLSSDGKNYNSFPVMRIKKNDEVIAGYISNGNIVPLSTSNHYGTYFSYNTYSMDYIKSATVTYRRNDNLLNTCGKCTHNFGVSYEYKQTHTQKNYSEEGGYTESRIYSNGFSFSLYKSLGENFIRNVISNLSFDDFLKNHYEVFETFKSYVPPEE